MGSNHLSVLIVFAHPDDEAFGLGGTIARLGRQGVDVHILLATRGEAGGISDPALDTPEVRQDLGAVRVAEARAAAAALGARACECLGYPDGALATVDAAELTLRVAEAIRRVAADVVITFGPEGIYGHPDHVTIGEIATEAFHLAADTAVAMPDLPPHAAARLFYQVITSETASLLNARRGPVKLDGRELFFVGYTDREITTRVDIRDVLEVKLRGLACHRTQTGEHMDEIRQWLLAASPHEHLILARTRVPPAPGLRDDPLSGLGTASGRDPLGGAKLPRPSNQRHGHLRRTPGEGVDNG